MEEENKVITLNVGGNIFYTTRETLCAVGTSHLAAMFGGNWNTSSLMHDNEGRIFLDYDPKCFEIILNWLRAYRLNPNISVGNIKVPFSLKTLLVYLNLNIPKYNLLNWYSDSCRIEGRTIYITESIQAKLDYWNTLDDIPNIIRIRNDSQKELYIWISISNGQDSSNTEEQVINTHIHQFLEKTRKNYGPSFADDTEQMNSFKTEIRKIWKLSSVALDPGEDLIFNLSEDKYCLVINNRYETYGSPAKVKIFMPCELRLLILKDNFQTEIKEPFKLTLVDEFF